MGAFGHGTTASADNKLTKAEWEGVTLHRFASAAAGDIGYDNGTSFVGLAKGAAGTILTQNAGLTAPEWFDGITLSNDGTITTILGKTGDYTRIGDATTTSHSLASEDDLLVTGKLEVDGVAFFDAAVTFASDNTWSTAQTGMTLTSPTINGTIATTGLTLPAVTLGGNMTVTGYAFDAGAGSAQINTTGALESLILNSINVGGYGPDIRLRHTSSSPANGDIVGRVLYQGYDDGSTLRTYGYSRVLISDVQAASFTSSFSWVLFNSATENEVMSLTGAGGLAVDLDNGGTDYYVGLFDEYDDALVIKQGIQENNRELLADMGVLDRKDTGSGYMLKIQSMIRFQAGAIYQTRALLEALARKVGISIDELINEVKQIPDSGWGQKQLGAG